MVTSHERLAASWVRADIDLLDLSEAGRLPLLAQIAGAIVRHVSSGGGAPSSSILVSTKLDLLERKEQAQQTGEGCPRDDRHVRESARREQQWNGCTE